MRREVMALGAVAALLGVLVVSGMTGLVLYDLLPESQALPVLSTDGYDQAVVEPNLFSVHLRTDCRTIEIVTNEFQALSIRKGMDGRRDFRPETHDIVQDILETFEMDVIMAKIEKVVQGTYYAKLIIRQDNRILNLDAKPSDAIAIAVRAGAPVYVHGDVLDQFGQRVC